MKSLLPQALSLSLAVSLSGLISNTPGNAATVNTQASDKAAVNKSQTKPDATLSDSEKYIAELDKRCRDLEKRAQSAARDGRLPQHIFAELQQALERLQDMIADCREPFGEMTKWEYFNLMVAVDKLSDRLESQMKDRDVIITDLPLAIQEIQERINEGEHSGRLSGQETSDLNREMGHIRDHMAKLKQAHNGLTYADQMKLSLELDRLSKRVEDGLGDRTIGILDTSGRSEQLDKLLLEGVNQNKLSASQAAEFKQVLSDITNRSKNEKKAGRILSDEETLALGLQFDQLEKQIRKILSKQSIAVADLRKEQKNLELAITDALVSGHLTPHEAYDLLDDINNIQTELNLPDTEVSASDAHLNSLAHKISKLRGMLILTAHAPTNLWAGIETYQTHLNHQMKDGLAAKRLSNDDFKYLSSEAARLAKQAETYKHDNSWTSIDNTLSFCAELQRLDSELVKRLKDRQVSQPDLDNLINSVDRRLGDALSSGALSIEGCRELANDLKDITELKQQWSSESKAFDARRKLHLAAELERLAARIGTEEHDIKPQPISLETRRNQIHELITYGLSTGRLTKPEAQKLQIEIKHLSQQETQSRSASGGLPAKEALSLASETERLFERLESQLREKYIPLNDLLGLQDEVERRIAEGVTSGRLSLKEGRSLRRQLDDIIRNMQVQQVKDGGLSAGERLSFEYELARCASQTEMTIREQLLIPPNLLDRHRALDARLGLAVANGSISFKEAQGIMAQLDTLPVLATEYRRSGGGLSYAESLVLSRDLEALAEMIAEHEKMAKSNTGSIDQKQSAIESKIIKAETEGHLSQQDAADLKQELARIAQTEADFRTSEEILTFVEAATLIAELDRVDSNLQQLLENPQFNRNLQQLSTRVRNELIKALTAKRLSTQEGDQLKADLAKLDQQWKNTSVKLTSSSATTLSDRYEQLRQRINRHSPKTKS